MTNVPPVCVEKGLRLLWSDEFDYADSKLEENWVAENKSPTHILCSRWRENAVVTNGMLRLCNRKESRGGKKWTSASVWTKARFKYGYFECRYRYAAATGTNNSFWFLALPNGADKGFEIDVNEGHYPSKINTNVHDYGKVYFKDGKKTHKTSSKAFDLGHSVDLSKEFHVYGFLWTADELVFYFDGKEIRRVKNEVCHSRCALLLSEAVLNWAGPVGDAIDGTFMEVDYVRAYGISGIKDSHATNGITVVFNPWVESWMESGFSPGMGMPMCYTLFPDFLDCIVPSFSINPSMRIEEALKALEKSLNPPGRNGIDNKGPVRVEFFTALNYLAPMPQMTWTNVPVRKVLVDIAKADRVEYLCLWNAKTRVVSFLDRSELNGRELNALLRCRGCYSVRGELFILPDDWFFPYIL